VTLVGAYGIGKTRMAGEIAGDARREGAAVLYATGTAPEAALAAIARTRDARQTTLLVLDEADRAPAEVRAALRRSGRRSVACRRSCWPPARRRPRRAAGAARTRARPSLAVRAVQRALDPLSVRLAADHLVRDPLDYLGNAGFEIDRVQRLKRGIVERVVARKSGTQAGMAAAGT
jgi:hypothetical protein